MENIKQRSIIALIVIISLVTVSSKKNNTYILYKDSSKPVDARVEDLLSRMTLEEKFWQMYMIPGDLDGKDAHERYKNGIFGFQTSSQSQSNNIAEQLINYNGSNNTTAIETAKKINRMQKFFVENTRLGIPIIAFDEALHGLIRPGATAFPQSIAMAATWDTTLIGEAATAIALEVKSRGIRDILSPVVNIANDVRWGRTEESYGEDPYLSSRMGVAFVSKFEKMGIITTPKHYIANVGDGGRDSYPINANERALREYYLPPFEACIREGGSRSIMTSYNSWDGTACTSNEYLLKDVLKNEIGFNGFVISDAGATGGANVLHMTAKDYTESTSQAINGGLDVIFQTAYEHWTLFYDAFNKGLIDKNNIDEAVRRILRAKFELGLFENPYVDENWAEKENNSKDKQELSRKIARESFVLLKNDKTLPIDTGKIKSIALIGEEMVTARLGGYSGPGCNKVSIYDGIRSYLENTGIKINYCKGTGLNSDRFSIVKSKYLRNNDNTSGLQGEYYSNDKFEGKYEFLRTDNTINFGWTLYSPDPDKLLFDNYSIRWNGKIHSPVSGKIHIGIEGNDGYRLWIDNKLLIDNFQKKSYGRCIKEFDFEKDQEYDIKLEYYENTGNARLKLIWDVEATDQDFTEALEASKNSDITIVAVGIKEGEFQDRALLSLPGRQSELINIIKKSGKPVVVLLVGGSAVTMSEWESGVNSILDIWYPGEKGGLAVADILFGDYSPSGKLPITFPMHEGQLPLYYNHKPTGRGDDYNNLSGQPLFPFGHGLSYTTFEYSDIQISSKQIKEDETVTISCLIKNTGKFAGEEVIQLYTRDMVASVSQPVMQLKDFKKIYLKTGEQKRVSFNLNPSEKLWIYDKNMKSIVEPGEFRIMIGSSSKDIRLKDILTVIK